jgi:hypothetical protein
MRALRTLALCLLVCLTASPALAGWSDVLKGAQEAVDKYGGDQAAQSASSLAHEEIVAGLKEALDKAVRTAVSQLGQEGGFLADPEVKIPLPQRLQRVEGVLRGAGYDETVDSFVESMNRAAEQAVPETVDVLSGAVSDLTLDKAREILDGPEDAATRYFEETTRDELSTRIEPLVSEATDSVGVTARYKALTDKAALLSPFMDTQGLDLDGYVTGEALDGLFLVMAQEEQRIREDPAARTTELLKKVFGGE